MPRFGLKKLRDECCHVLDGRWQPHPYLSDWFPRQMVGRIHKAMHRGNALLTRTPAAKVVRSPAPATRWTNDCGNYRGKRKPRFPSQVRESRRVYSAPSNVDGFGAMAAIALMAAKFRRRRAPET